MQQRHNCDRLLTRGHAVKNYTLMSCRLSVILPAFNEEVSLERTIRSCVQFLRTQEIPAEVIIVDDGSMDRTGVIAGALSRECPMVRVLNHPCNRGYGVALRTGFEAAVGEAVLFMDADGQFDITDLTVMLKELETCDIVSGARLQRNDSMLRLVASRSYNAISRLVLPITTVDVNCAFKLMRREVLAGLHLRSCGFGLAAELIAKAEHQHLRIKVFPVQHHPLLGGRSTVSMRSILPALRELWNIRRGLREVTPLFPSHIPPCAVSSSQHSLK